MKSQVQIASIFSLVLLVVCGLAKSSDLQTPVSTVLGGDNSAPVMEFFVDGYSFQLSDPQVEMKIELFSPDFDTYLIVIPPNGRPVVDDDSGDGHNSRLIVSNMAAGTWRVLVTSYAPHRRGRYTLTTAPPTKFVSDREFASSSDLVREILDRPESVLAAAAAAAAEEEAPASYYPENSLHFLPWPPPQASAMAVLPTRVLFSDSDWNPGMRLSNVDQRLTQALTAAGYSESSYYRIPNGFALVTRIEQIKDDGTPLDPPARWSIDISPLDRFSLLEYLRALFAARNGYFRVIVFAVTSQPFVQTEDHVRRSEALAWLRSGFNVLPHEIGDLEYTQRHQVTALVYEFLKPRAAQNAEFLVPGKIDGLSHLRKSGVISALER